MRQFVADGLSLRVKIGILKHLSFMRGEGMVFAKIGDDDLGTTKTTEACDSAGVYLTAGFFGIYGIGWRGSVFFEEDA